MGTQLPYKEEFCPECGNFVSVAEFNSETGWCNGCSAELGYIVIAPSCPICSRETSDGKLCSRCKYESWLRRNADAIETVMVSERVSVAVAKRIVAAQNRPICLSCRQPIKGGQKNRHFFCTKRPECAKGHRTYEYHIRNKPQAEALALAVTASVIYKLTASIYK